MEYFCEENGKTYVGVITEKACCDKCVFNENRKAGTKVDLCFKIWRRFNSCNELYWKEKPKEYTINDLKGGVKIRFKPYDDMEDIGPGKAAGMRKLGDGVYTISLILTTAFRIKERNSIGIDNFWYSPRWIEEIIPEGKSVEETFAVEINNTTYKIKPFALEDFYNMKPSFGSFGKLMEEYRTRNWVVEKKINCEDYFFNFSYQKDIELFCENGFAEKVETVLKPGMILVNEGDNFEFVVVPDGRLYFCKGWEGNHTYLRVGGKEIKPKTLEEFNEVSCYGGYKLKF